jgi:hypothetical protein
MCISTGCAVSDAGRKQSCGNGQPEAVTHHALGEIPL